MAFKAGTTSAFYLANAANALQNLSAYADNLSLPQSTEQLDVSVFGSSSKAFIPGLQDGDTITMSGPYDVVMHTHLTTAKSAGSLLGFIFGPGGSVAAQARSAGSVYVQNYSVSTSVGGRVEYSASLQITGAVTNGTF
jgi:hypothetical protein